MTDTSTSTTSQAKQQAQEVGSNAASRAGDVMAEAGDQAKAVTSQAKDEARRVWEQARSEATDQAQQRSQQAAGNLRTLADRIGSLAEGDTGQAGPLVGYLQEGRDRVSGLADRLERGPDAVMQDIRTFARQKPLVFLACAGGLGFVAGRLVRAGAGGGDGSQGAPTTSGTASMQPSAAASPVGIDPLDAGMAAPTFPPPTTPDPLADPMAEPVVGDPLLSASDAEIGDLGSAPRPHDPAEGRR